MQHYSPFDKPLDNLKASDLASLRTTPEGWYVEYKSQFPAPASVAKSLSAFANSYGGWLFYGIEESADKQRHAGAFPGIQADQVPLCEQKIRQAASVQVSPPPYFQVRALYGPEDSIGLSAGRAIIIVQIPYGKNTPYVHASGRIYRRIADSSDPTHETDRHFLDLLWQRSKAHRRIFSKFVRRKSELSDAERRYSYIKLYFFPDPWMERDIRSRMDFRNFARIMKGDPIPFDNIFPSSNAHTARQVSGRDPNRLALTWRYFSDCTSEVTIPINSIEFDDVEELRKFLNGYEQAESFVELCSAADFKHASVIDLSILLLALVAISRRRLQLYEYDGFYEQDFFKAQLRGIWRRIPFIDTAELISFSKDCGLPVVQTKWSLAPAGDEPDNCHKLSEHAPSGTVQPTPESGHEGYLDGCWMLMFICQSLGIPSHVLGLGDLGADSSTEVLTRMIEMGSRAQVVGRGRP